MAAYGVVELSTRWDPHTCTERVTVERIDPFTLISVELLEVVIAGNAPGLHVEHPHLILTADNGTWRFHIGRYDPDHGGVALQLVTGQPSPSADHTATDLA